MNALQWFYSFFTPGQWVVILLAGMVVFALLTWLGSLADGDPDHLVRLLWGTFGFLLLFLLWNVLISVISICQWLWGL